MTIKNQTVCCLVLIIRYFTKNSSIRCHFQVFQLHLTENLIFFHFFCILFLHDKLSKSRANRMVSGHISVPSYVYIPIYFRYSSIYYLCILRNIFAWYIPAHRIRDKWTIEATTTNRRNQRPQVRVKVSRIPMLLLTRCDLS